MFALMMLGFIVGTRVILAGTTEPFPIEDVAPLVPICAAGILVGVVNMFRVGRIRNAVSVLSAQEERRLETSWLEAVATAKTLVIGTAGVLIVFVGDLWITQGVRANGADVEYILPREWGASLLLLLSFGLIIQTFTSGRERYTKFLFALEERDERTREVEAIAQRCASACQRELTREHRLTIHVGRFDIHLIRRRREPTDHS